MNDQEHTSRVVRNFFIAFGILAVCLMSAAVIVGVADQDSQVVINNPPAPVATAVYLTVSPGLKPAPDGQLHDAYSTTNFNVHPNQPVKLVINNTDDVPHGIDSPEAGVKIKVRPGTHTYTLLVKSPGTYEWHCNFPCDPFSMSHEGYMMGTITAE